jgi:hypothetical protein
MRLRAASICATIGQIEHFAKSQKPVLDTNYASGLAKQMRLNMRANLKVILSAAGVAALLASPAMARHRHVAPSTVYIPSDVRGAVVPYGYGVYEGGPYTPSIPTPARSLNPDFQDGSRG